MRVGCVIVTYNKLNMLKECINAVLNQTRKIDEIFLIDNCSSDKTKDYAAQLTEQQRNIHYYRLSNNIGGAGGFNYGLKRAFSAEIDYIWIMDNDTIPTETAVEKLLEHVDDSQLDMGFLCSMVNWTDGKPCIMNIPTVGDSWTEYLDRKLVRVRSASFVSLLIPKRAIEEVGYPIKEFFIWGDDMEFTSRITHKRAGYLVTDSYVIHKMGQNTTTDIFKDGANRIDRYFFDYRNRTFIAKRSSKKELLRTLLKAIAMILRVSLHKNDHKLKKLWIISKGTIIGLFFNPRIEKE